MLSFPLGSCISKLEGNESTLRMPRLIKKKIIAIIKKKRWELICYFHLLVSIFLRIVITLAHSEVSMISSEILLWKWHPFLHEKFPSKVKSYLVKELFSYIFSSLHYLPLPPQKAAAGERVMPQKFASVVAQALHPTLSKSDQCPCGESDYTREINPSQALLFL